MTDLNSLFKPGTVTFLEVRHDPDCPGAHGDPDSCVCQPDFAIHQDEGRFIAGETWNRAARRAAEKAARRAVAQAKRKGTRG